jgi:hypothetical protein
MLERQFRPGFRLSALDIVVLIVSGVASGFLLTFDRWLGVAVAFVMLHFFLFCNVLRMSRSLELVWSAIFAGLAVATILLNPAWWPMVFAVSLVVTVITAIIETRRPSYHGVGWKKFNPGLLEWWRSSGNGKV